MQRCMPFARLALALALAAPVACASAGASLKSYVAPSIAAGAVRSVAILPMRNARLLPDEASELNREFTIAFHDRNPNVSVIGPAEATQAMNTADLTERYTDFLRDYAASGIPNARVLQQIGAALHVDAIVQGEVFDLRQRDGEFGAHRGESEVTVRYALLGLTHGTVLWEGTSHAHDSRATTIGKAPPMYEVISIAQTKILTAMPQLGTGQR